MRFARQRLGRIKSAVDLRQMMSPVRSQGATGSCTGMALCGLRESLEIQAHLRQGEPPVYTPLSVADLYYQERVTEGTRDQDAGAMIRTGLQILKSRGALPESYWPYEGSVFNEPPALLPDEGEQAELHNISAYYRVFNLRQLRRTLSFGHPVVIGFLVYESAESDQALTTGVIPYPRDSEQLKGGHAVIVAGHDDARQMILTKGSWGTDVGDKGYFWMPYTFWTTPGRYPLILDQWSAVDERTSP